MERAVIDDEIYPSVALFGPSVEMDLFAVGLMRMYTISTCKREGKSVCP